MKFKKKLNTFLSAILVFFASFALTGCADGWGAWFKPDLEAVTVLLNSDQTTLSWQAVTNAEEYLVYSNEQLAATVVNKAGVNTYNFSSLLKENISVYKFYIVATSEGYNDSAKSNVVTYLNSTNETSVVSSAVVSNNNLNIVTNLTIGSNILSWDQVVGAQQYYVFMYSNTLGERIIETKVNAFDFTEYVSEDQVVMFRVGVKNEEDVILMSLPIYHNTCTLQPTYNNKYFYLDGVLGDHYITSQEELNTIVYYAFVYKIEELPVYFSNDYMNEIVNTYGPEAQYYDYVSGTYKIRQFNHLIKAISAACNSYTESCDYDTSLGDVTEDDYYKKDFKIKFKYNSGFEPTNSMEKLRTQNEFDTPYYERVSYEKRSSDFNDFASDKQPLVEYVSTAEQLYHVVESGATPLFKTTTNNSAYTIYNKAKQVLREIVCDDMTTYEKVLSIFDYICYNTVYDDEIVDYNDETPSFASYTCFYLEGVFNDGLAVCDGFSKAFALLCNMEGIDAYRITGEVSGGLHAWNKVKIDGNWYVVDITWTVSSTSENDFTTGGEAVNFNNTEFLSYKYFLVSDNFVKDTHFASNTKLNNSLAALNEYYYYYNQTYDGTNNLIISSDAEFESLINYMLTNKLYTFEIAFDDNYICSPSIFNSTHDADLTAACLNVKDACEISNSNILTIGYMHKKISANLTGTTYSLTLINLPEAIKNA